MKFFSNSEENFKCMFNDQKHNSRWNPGPERNQMKKKYLMYDSLESPNSPTPSTIFSFHLCMKKIVLSFNRFKQRKKGKTIGILCRRCRL